MRRRVPGPQNLRFLAFAIIFLAVAHQLFWKPERVVAPEILKQAREAATVTEEIVVVDPEPQPRPVIMAPKTEIILPDMPPPDPAWKKYAVTAPEAAGKPKIVIIIDDMGVDRKRTAEVVALPAPLTLAYLPYPSGIREQVEEGRRAGHEIMMHIPMEPMNASADPGPDALLMSAGPEVLKQKLEKNLSAFDGYIGINNHMGSRMTEDNDKMEFVMNALKARGLAFVDSVTSDNSVAEDKAIEAGLAHAARDVFLDHDESRAAVDAALAKTERVAREQGYAIAIGHPKDNTIAALAAWLPMVVEKGFAIVPVSVVLIQDSVIPAQAGIHGAASADR